MREYYLGYRNEDGNFPPIEGSLPFKCSKCGVMVYVAPKGQKLLKARQIPVICLPCAEKVGRVKAA